MTGPVRISIIIPVLAERDRINRLISHLSALAADNEPEIIVVDGDPAGDTIAAITHDRIRTARSAPGRAAQMNAGASLAGGDVLLFLHADTMLPAAAFSLIRDALGKSPVVGGAFELGLDSPRWYFRITECYVALRTRITGVPFGDQAIFIRKTYFEKIGGYRNIPIMEDVELMRRIRKRGDRISLLAAKAMTSSRRWEKEGVLFTTCRNLLLQVLYCCGISPERLAKHYH